MNTKLIAILSVVGLVLLGAAAYFIYRKPIRELPPVTLHASRLLADKIYYPQVNASGTSVSYLAKGANAGLYRMNLKTKKIEQTILATGISGVIWSPDGRYAIFTVFQDKKLLQKINSPFIVSDAQEGAATVWMIDMTTGKRERLPDAINSMVWDQGGKYLYYYYLDMLSRTGISQLRRRLPFAKTEETLVSLPATDSYASQFLSNDVLLMVPGTSGTDSVSSLYYYTLSTEKLSVTKENLIQKASASPDGKTVLYASIGENSTWHLLDWSSQRDRDLRLGATNYYAFWTSSSDILTGTVKEGSDQFALVKINNLTRQPVTIQYDSALPIEQVFPLGGRTIYFTAGDILYTVDLP